MIPGAFSGKQEKVQESQQHEIDELHRQIGRLIVERDLLKKSPRIGQESMDRSTI